MEELEMGAQRTAAALRTKLNQMTAASCALEGVVRDENGLRYLGMLNQSICQMMRIAGRISLCGRLSGEEPELERETLDLADLVRELGGEMRSLLAAAGVELAVFCPERLLCRADGALIRQLLLELVSNAARAGRRVELTLERRGESAALSVADDGPGVPPERLAAMFNGDGEQVPDWRRAGNGVAIARKIALLHGGRLLASALPGGGMRMAATVPLEPDGAEGLRDRPRAGWDHGGFSEALVGLSELLPSGVFAPGGEEA